MQPKNSNPCEFFQHVKEYEANYYLPNNGQTEQGKDDVKAQDANENESVKADKKKEFLNLVHQKDQTKKITIYEHTDNFKLSYNLNDEKYESTLKSAEPQCACMINTFKKVDAITKFGKDLLFDFCSNEKCLKNYFKQSPIQRSKSASIERLRTLFSQASIPLERFVLLQKSEINRTDEERYEEEDKSHTAKYKEIFGELPIPQQDFEHDLLTRLINYFECHVSQVQNIADELNLDFNKTLRHYTILQDWTLTLTNKAISVKP